MPITSDSKKQPLLLIYGYTGPVCNVKKEHRMQSIFNRTNGISHVQNGILQRLYSTVGMDKGWICPAEVDSSTVLLLAPEMITIGK